VFIDKLHLICGFTLCYFLLERDYRIIRGLFVLFYILHTGTLTQGNSVIFKRITFATLTTNSPILRKEKAHDLFHKKALLIFTVSQISAVLMSKFFFFKRKHFVENSFWMKLWTCHKRDNKMNEWMNERINEDPI
jgi:hypothetical protein